jgi:hypothetical protein
MEDVILAKQNWIPIALVFSNKILSFFSPTTMPNEALATL